MNRRLGYFMEAASFSYEETSSKICCFAEAVVRFCYRAVAFAVRQQHKNSQGSKFRWKIIVISTRNSTPEGI